MRRKLTLIFIVVLLAAGMLSYLVYKSNQKRIHSVKLIQQTIEVGYQTAKISAIETQIKTLLLSYQITKDTSLLIPIATAQGKMIDEINALISLTRDNTLQYQRAQLLRKFSRVFLQAPQSLSKTASPSVLIAEKNFTLQVTQMLNLIQQEEERLLIVRKALYAKNLDNFDLFNLIIFSFLLLCIVLLLWATHKISFQEDEKGLRAGELDLANKTLFFESKQKQKRASELVVAKKELFFQKGEKGKRAAELRIADKERLYQSDEKEKRAAELIIANKELSFQNDEKEKRAQELGIANKELSFQNNEKEQRAAELILANIELSFQSEEKEKRAQELSVANIELSFQNNEKEKRAEELKKTMIQLNKSESSLREAQAISHIGNFEIDLVNENEVWSDGMYSILELEKALTKPSISHFLKYIHPSDVDEIRKEITQSFNTYKLSKFEFRFYKTNGALRYGHTEIQFELSSTGTPLRVFGIFQDITDNKLAELERIKIVKELIQRNKDLEQFAYIISHNLRAPVANILGASEILKLNDNDAADEIVLKKGINESVLKLDGVIKDLNHILDIKTSIHQQQELVSFSDLVIDIRNSIKRLIDQNDVIITCNFDEVDELLTLKPYLYSIFYNLITNSIKYRKKRTQVKITITSKKTITGTTLEFSDNGLGIDLQKNSDQLFGLYKRFHDHVEGKGMGLFMVKTQVEALEGSIQVKSSFKKGTTFTISF